MYYVLYWLCLLWVTECVRHFLYQNRSNYRVFFSFFLFFSLFFFPTIHKMCLFGHTWSYEFKRGIDELFYFLNKFWIMMGKKKHIWKIKITNACIPLFWSEWSDIFLLDINAPFWLSTIDCLYKYTNKKKKKTVMYIYAHLYDAS